LMLGQEPRQTTSNLGHLNKPSIQALIHGLNRHYYSLGISYRKNPLEEQMLLNLHKKRWSDGLQLERWDERTTANAAQLASLAELAAQYDKAVQEEETLSPEKLALAGVGRQDAKKRLESGVQILLSDNICQTLGSMLDTICF
jgi:26S proteasome regulatory subunit N11